MNKQKQKEKIIEVITTTIKPEKLSNEDICIIADSLIEAGFAEKKSFAEHVGGAIAGHSNYHGDSILCALYCAAEGKEIDYVKPLSIDKLKHNLQEIEQLKAENARLIAENAELKARLEKAVELPCKVGDTVWCIRAYGKGYQIEENSVIEIVFEYGNNMRIKTSRGLFGYDKWTYGLDCFTDRSEAEARLAELNGGKNEV